MILVRDCCKNRNFRNAVVLRPKGGVKANAHVPAVSRQIGLERLVVYGDACNRRSAREIQLELRGPQGKGIELHFGWRDNDLRYHVGVYCTTEFLDRPGGGARGTIGNGYSRHKISCSSKQVNLAVQSVMLV